MQRDVAWPLTRLLGEVQDIKRDITQLEVCQCTVLKQIQACMAATATPSRPGPTLQVECLAAHPSSCLIS